MTATVLAGFSPMSWDGIFGSHGNDVVFWGADGTWEVSRPVSR